MTTYDAVVVGGGLGGSTLADQLARAGYDVLVLERERRFRDRVRGENMLPWGVAAARRLGIHESLIEAGARPAANCVVYSMGEPSPGVAGGATVKRGATVIGIDGANGRASRVRSWGGFQIQRSADQLTIAGMLIDGSEVPENGAYLCMGPGAATFWAPLGGGRARAYFVYPSTAGRRGSSGDERIKEFFDALQICRHAAVVDGDGRVCRPARRVRRRAAVGGAFLGPRDERARRLMLGLE